METLCLKIKLSFCFQLDKLVDKVIFSFYSYNKINDPVATECSNKIYYTFYLNS